MKTPRDILFARHENAVPKLDALRREVIVELNHHDTNAPDCLSRLVSWCLGGFNKIWLELIFPSRRLWSGLATVWVLLFIVNFSQRDNVSSKTVHPGGAVMSLQAQQRLMNELLADRSTPVEADRPPNFPPKPRTEIAETAAV